MLYNDAVAFFREENETENHVRLKLSALLGLSTAAVFAWKKLDYIPSGPAYSLHAITGGVLPIHAKAPYHVNQLARLRSARMDEVLADCIKRAKSKRKEAA